MSLSRRKFFQFLFFLSVFSYQDVNRTSPEIGKYSQQEFYVNSIIFNQSFKLTFFSKGFYLNLLKFSQSFILTFLFSKRFILTSQKLTSFFLLCILKKKHSIDLGKSFKFHKNVASFGAKVKGSLKNIMLKWLLCVNSH